MENENRSPMEQIAFYKEQLMRFHKASLKKQGIDPDRRLTREQSDAAAAKQPPASVHAPAREAATAWQPANRAAEETQAPLENALPGLDTQALPAAAQKPFKAASPLAPSEGAPISPPASAPQLTPTGQENPYVVTQREDRPGHNPWDGSSAYTGEANPDLQTRTDFEETNAQTGFLKARVTVARQALPLKNAKVSISKEFLEGRYTYAVLYTDQSGKTESVALPAPSRQISEEPEENGIRGFSSYDILVEAPGYVTVENRNVPVFEDIVSVQPVAMVPESLSEQLNDSAFRN